MQAFFYCGFLFQPLFISATIRYSLKYRIVCASMTAMETKQVLAALSALAQESRLAVFRLLVQLGPEGMAASKIGEQLGIAPSSLSFHLKELSHAGLIGARQDGRFVIYSADVGAMNGLIGFLTENCCGGVPCGPTLTGCKP
jgi:ArsR family transcriptional regulator